MPRLLRVRLFSYLCIIIYWTVLASWGILKQPNTHRFFYGSLV